MLTQSPSSASLASWLDTATGKLVPSAQRRLRAEIEAHYAEAVLAKQAAGATEPDAQAAALVELGNAKDAAKRFCRQYLTRSHAKSLSAEAKDLDTKPPAPIYFFAMVCMIMVILRYITRSQLSGLFWVSFTFASFAVTMVATIGVYHLSRNAPPRRKYLWCHFRLMLKVLNITAMMIVALLDVPAPLFAFVVTIPIFFIFVFCLQQRKIRRVPEEDLPPLDGSNA